MGTLINIIYRNNDSSGRLMEKINNKNELGEGKF